MKEKKQNLGDGCCQIKREPEGKRGFYSLEHIGVTVIILHCLVCSYPQEGRWQPGVQHD